MKIRKLTATANTTYCPGRKIIYLVVHYTAGVNPKVGAARGCAAWFANPAASGSADYIVDEEELVQYNPDPMNRYCQAVGGARYNTQGGRLFGVATNSNCVNLEICSGNMKGKITYPNDPGYYFSYEVLLRAREAVQYLKRLYGIDAEHVIRHYDVNGKPCPGIIGWNKDSGDESRWEDFHASICEKPIAWYRVGTSWENGKCMNQVEADEKLENAKTTADRYGYKVFDAEGVLIYEAKPVGMSGSTLAKEINLLVDEQAKALAILELVHRTDYSGILYSVTAAQMILESGYCGTDLAVNANNCFGLKANLSGNTWKSTWDGRSVYGKITDEQDKLGDVYRVYAEFRKYPCVEDSIRDHGLYLLQAMNGSRLRYAGLTEAKDYCGAIKIIKAGGYATDVNYEEKICGIIRRYGLDRYDREGTSEVKTETAAELSSEADEAKKYVVQAGAFTFKKNARRRLKAVKRLGGDFRKSIIEKRGGNYVVQIGVFDQEANARVMAAALAKAGVEWHILVR